MVAFRQKNLTLHKAAVEILDAERPMTLRQLYYRLISAGELANKQAEYKRLGSVMTRLRQMLSEFGLVCRVLAPFLAIAGYRSRPVASILHALRCASVQSKSVKFCKVCWGGVSSGMTLTVWPEVQRVLRSSRGHRPPELLKVGK